MFHTLYSTLLHPSVIESSSTSTLSSISIACTKSGAKVSSKVACYVCIVKVMSVDKSPST